MSGASRFLRSWWWVSTLATAIAALLVCVALPMIVPALQPLWVRALILALLLAAWTTLALLEARRARLGAEGLAAGLASGDRAEGEERLIAQRMADAMEKLRTGEKGFRQRNYLYEKPWYVIIGPPGAGKTTALINSGLHFPFEDRSLSGTGGTRNLDFMFADNAILLDTAGRYTSQDSEASVDARGWQSFLGLLKKYRPLQPINGLIVAIGIDELVGGDCALIDAHAAAVRRRLGELRSALGLAMPIYVMLTKADLLAGFIEYFDYLDAEARRQVLGYTFSGSSSRPTTDRLIEAFDELAREVALRQAKRLHEEDDAQRRALILGFPGQLVKLRARLIRFLEGAFVSADEPVELLRGIYVTSGVQQGAPLDRILAGMSAVYQTPASTENSTSRAYFLNRLLGDVMFAEAGSVQFNPQTRQKRRVRTIAAVAGIAVAAVLTVVLWAVSFVQNRQFEADTLVAARDAGALVRDTGIDLKRVRTGAPGLGETLQALRALRQLPQGYAAQQAGGSLLMRAGLYQGGLSDAAQEAYRDGLRRILLPRLLLDLEDAMKADLANGRDVRQPLDIYLMLGGLADMDPALVERWFAARWEDRIQPGPSGGPARRELADHLAALIEDDGMLGVWQGRTAPLDGALIAEARRTAGRAPA